MTLRQEEVCNAVETRVKQEWHNSVDDYQIENPIIGSDTESESIPEEQQDDHFNEAVARINSQRKIQRAEKQLCGECECAIPAGAVSCPSCGIALGEMEEADPTEMVQTFEEVWSVIANAHQKRAKRLLNKGINFSQLFATFREIREKGKNYWKRLQEHNNAVFNGTNSPIKMRVGPPIELETVVDMFDLTNWGDTMVQNSHITRDDVAVAAFAWYYDVRTSRSDVVEQTDRSQRTKRRTVWSSEAVVTQSWPGDEEASRDRVCIQAQNVDPNALAVVRRSDITAAADVSHKAIPVIGLRDSAAHDHVYVAGKGKSHDRSTRGDRASNFTRQAGASASHSASQAGASASHSAAQTGASASHSGGKRQRIEEAPRERQPRWVHSAPRQEAESSLVRSVTPPWRQQPSSSATTMVRAPTLRAAPRRVASSSSRAVMKRPDWLPEEIDSESEELLYFSPSNY